MVLIVDGNNTAYRALHTISLSFKGEDTSIIFGVLRMIQTMVKQHHPRSVIVCWDRGIPEYRRQLVPTYKAGRTKSDDVDWDAVYKQMDILCDLILPIHGVLTLSKQDCEADDLMYWASKMVCDRPYIVTSDDDMLQAVDKRTSVIHPMKGKIITWDNFEREVGVPPHLYVSYKTLVGDSSDNIPGVKGIGPKTAPKCLKVNGEWMPNPIDDEGGGMCLNMSGSLVRHIPAVQQADLLGMYWCMNLGIDNCGAHHAIQSDSWTPADAERIKRILMRYGFNSLLSQGGEYTGLFSKLERPIFKTVRTPVMDFWAKEPVE